MVNSRKIQTDVAVIGYGGAGAAAAITAHDSGARVLVLEKTASGGGNTTLSTGILIVPTGPGMISYIEALCFGKTSSDIIETYVDGCARICDWIEEIGGETQIYQPLDVVYPPRLPSWPNFPGANHVQMRRVVASGSHELPGVVLWKLLKDSVERRGIEVLTETPASELLTNQHGEVVGVIASGNDGEILIEANKAVILTCGSFDFNDELKDTYLPFSPTFGGGHTGNTGDALLMGQKVGAALWHMNALAGGLVFKAPEYPSSFSLYFHYPSFIYVDKDGRRFMDETGWETHNVWRGLMVYMRLRNNYPHLPIYAIFDDIARKRGPLCGVLATANSYEWSLDNSKEVARGWIKQAKTIEELGRRISVDESTLVKTVAMYNEDCKAGRDTEWNRSRESMEPIAVPSYYAIEYWPSARPFGGLRRDKEARVVSKEGKPIPRLYSAGSVGPIWGFLGTAGSGLTDAIVFGRIAGRNAAAEKPW